MDESFEEFIVEFDGKKIKLLVTVPFEVYALYKKSFIKMITGIENFLN